MRANQLDDALVAFHHVDVLYMVEGECAGQHHTQTQAVDKHPDRLLRPAPDRVQWLQVIALFGVRV